MLREGTRPGGICFPCSSPTARDLLFQSYWEPLRKLVSTFKVINKYTEGKCVVPSNVQLGFTRGMKNVRAELGLLRTCEMLVKDILGK